MARAVLGSESIHNLDAVQITAIKSWYSNKFVADHISKNLDRGIQNYSRIRQAFDSGNIG